jgi:hypothetical protein
MVAVGLAGIAWFVFEGSADKFMLYKQSRRGSRQIYDPKRFHPSWLLRNLPNGSR